MAALMDFRFQLLPSSLVHCSGAKGQETDPAYNAAGIVQRVWQHTKEFLVIFAGSPLE